MNVDTHTQAHFCTRYEDGEETSTSGIGERSEMTRKGWLACKVVAGVAATLLPIAGWAQDIPCPTEQLIQQTRERNQARGKPKPEKFYQQLRQNYNEQCGMAKQALADLKPKLKEYEDGERDDRDGYIILRKLAWQYQVLRAESHPEAQAITKKMQSLEKKTPRLRDVRDDEISEEQTAKRKLADENAARRRAAQQWTPQDADPISEHVGDGFRIVAYQFRIEFFRQGQEAPATTLTFKHRVNTAPHPMNFAADSGTNILVCTRQDAGYSARTEAEERIIHLRGHAHGRMPWTNERGTHGSFCGVIDPTGNVVYEFPPMSHPNRLYVPVGIAGAGKRAAVKVGRFVRQKQIEGDDSEKLDTISDFKEAWVWEHPNTLRKVQLSKDDLWGNRLIKRLRDGSL